MNRTTIGSAALFLLGAAVFGCSHQEFSQPTLRRPAVVVGDLLDSREPYLEPSKSRAQQRMERLAKALAAWKVGPEQEAPDYLIGPGDVLEVGVLALETPDRTSTFKRTVSQDGLVTLPWVGSLPAAGVSARELEATIRAAYAGRYIKDPQVTVTVTEHRSAAVVVTGAVETPGVYYLTTNKSSVLALLAQAGGLTGEAGDELLIVRSVDTGDVVADSGDNPGSESGGSVLELAPGEAAEGSDVGGHGELRASELNAIAVDLKELVDQGNLLLNLEVRKGDIVTVPLRTKQYVYVLGYVQRPGAFELKDGVRADVLRGVALAGGLTAAARAENSFLVRETSEGQKVVPVDLTKIARGVRPPLYLEAGDTLVVGSSMVAKMAEFLRPTAGFHYSPGR